MRMCGGRASIHFICVCVVFFFIIGRELEWRASEEEAEAERAQGSFSTRACIQRTFLILIFDLSARGTDGAGFLKLTRPKPFCRHFEVLAVDPLLQKKVRALACVRLPFRENGATVKQRPLPILFEIAPM